MRVVLAQIELPTAPLAHADETGMRVGGALQ
jgi:hypothetical protein